VPCWASPCQLHQSLKGVRVSRWYHKCTFTLLGVVENQHHPLQHAELGFSEIPSTEYGLSREFFNIVCGSRLSDVKHWSTYIVVYSYVFMWERGTFLECRLLIVVFVSVRMNGVRGTMEVFVRSVVHMQCMFVGSVLTRNYKLHDWNKTEETIGKCGSNVLLGLLSCSSVHCFWIWRQAHQYKRYLKPISDSIRYCMLL